MKTYTNDELLDVLRSEIGRLETYGPAIVRSGKMSQARLTFLLGGLRQMSRDYGAPSEDQAAIGTLFGDDLK